MDPVFAAGGATAVAIFAVVMTTLQARRNNRQRTQDLAQHSYVCTDAAAAKRNLDPFSFDVVS